MTMKCFLGFHDLRIFDGKDYDAMRFYRCVRCFEVLLKSAARCQQIATLNGIKLRCEKTAGNHIHEYPTVIDDGGVPRAIVFPGTQDGTI